MIHQVVIHLSGQTKHRPTSLDMLGDHGSKYSTLGFIMRKIFSMFVSTLYCWISHCHLEPKKKGKGDIKKGSWPAKLCYYSYGFQTSTISCSY